MGGGWWYKTPERSGALTERDTGSEAPDVSGKRNDHGGQEFQGQAVNRKRGTRCFSPPQMDPGNQADQKSGGASEGEVEHNSPSSGPRVALQPKCRLRALATRCQRQARC